MKYKVAEIFTSINGEGQRAGELAVFVRFTGCNLQCSYCDTAWANTKAAPYHYMTETEIAEYVRRAGVRNVTLTGGEPLLQTELHELLKELAGLPQLRTEIETNGSVDIKPYLSETVRPAFTLDYKLPGSGMEAFMNTNNYQYLQPEDTVKFVVSDEKDMQRAETIIRQFDLSGKCGVYFSPVFGRIAPETIVTYMIEHQLNQVRIQLQLHKFIWDPEKRGV